MVLLRNKCYFDTRYGFPMHEYGRNEKREGANRWKRRKKKTRRITFQISYETMIYNFHPPSDT